jgi:YidC/Oxa1 family membrane protein insertase
MDNVRVFLWITFLALAWLAYTAWQQDYAALATPAPGVTVPAGLPPSADLPSVDAAAPAQPSSGGTEAPPLAPAAAPTRLVHVRTDVLDVQIDLEGGDLVRADLLQYPVSKHSPELVRLLDYQPQDYWVFQTGLRGVVAGAAEPNHLATFRAPSTDYTLAPGQDELVVTLDWAVDGPVAARKIYTFRRGQYTIDLALTATAGAAGDWRGVPYVRMARRHNPPGRSYTSVDSYSFTGPVLFDGTEYAKLDVEDLGETPIEQEVTGGWLAAIQHHFVAAAVPPVGDKVAYTANVRRDQDDADGEPRWRFLLTGVGPVVSATTTAPLDYHVQLFVGPKLQEQLKTAGPKLDQTVDYGKLSFLSAPMFWALSKIEVFVNNWGWAIVIMTLLIKLAFYKLTAMSGRSMAKMRKLAPRMKALQERYKEDRQALSQAMLEMYKKEKVNPAAGCVPLLVQMPFFFAFYWVLVESVEMRQAPFMLWIDDLSARDPFYVLPLLMGVAMFFQTRLNPAPPDPIQARVMQIMPIMFTFLFLWFPAGLVLYWLTSTLLSMLQQWRINHLVARESAAAA